ncbi:DUF4393 domain-containing protein [Patulibacter minatonensis]|uniref:DUF4393 domain-containing protein n=1 Tax=Patulibacter minatonensis TaxID=298163 RepID=UPI001B7FA5E6|nr:DUF4393 domain-containing protein [Patulibacter minatonensis]
MDNDHDGEPGAREPSALDALPGVARIATRGGIQAASWGARTGFRTGIGIAKRLPFGDVALKAAEEAAEQARHSARRLLGVDEVERRVMRMVPERVTEATRAWSAEHGTAAHQAAPQPDLDPLEVLQRRGAGLLAQAADVGFEEATHPAYARILDELTPDEARILRLMATKGAQPAVDVRTGRPLRIGSEMIAAGLTIIGAEAGCRYVERVPSYLNNLFRLGLIWFSHEELEDLRGYQVLEAQPEVGDAMKRAGRASRVVRRSIALTPFGDDFCRVCLPLGQLRATGTTIELDAIDPATLETRSSGSRDATPRPARGLGAARRQS